MFGKSFKPARPGAPVTRQVRELQRAVTASRNQRPGTGYRCVTTPFGTAMMSASTDWFTAFTATGPSAATVDGSGVTTVGTGTVYQTFPSFDPATGAMTLARDTSRTIPVYNLSQQPVATGANVIVGKVYGFLFVMWEDCSSS